MALTPLKNSVMEFDVRQLDMEELKALYEHEKAELQKHLLSGAAWSSLESKHKKVAELSALMYHKIALESLPVNNWRKK